MNGNYFMPVRQLRAKAWGGKIMAIDNIGNKRVIFLYPSFLFLTFLSSLSLPQLQMNFLLLPLP